METGEESARRSGIRVRRRSSGRPPFSIARAGRPLTLEPKAFDLLTLLLESHGEVVTKAEIFERLWPRYRGHRQRPYADRRPASEGARRRCARGEIHRDGAHPGVPVACGRPVGLRPRRDARRRIAGEGRECRRVPLPSLSRPASVSRRGAGRDPCGSRRAGAPEPVRAVSRRAPSPCAGPTDRSPGTRRVSDLLAGRPVHRLRIEPERSVRNHGARSRGRRGRSSRHRRQPAERAACVVAGWSGDRVSLATAWRDLDRAGSRWCVAADQPVRVEARVVSRRQADRVPVGSMRRHLAHGLQREHPIQHLGGRPRWTQRARADAPGEPGWRARRARMVARRSPHRIHHVRAQDRFTSGPFPPRAAIPHVFRE